jgi:hypothetical protein
MRANQTTITGGKTAFITGGIYIIVAATAQFNDSKIGDTRSQVASTFLNFTNIGHPPPVPTLIRID